MPPVSRTVSAENSVEDIASSGCHETAFGRDVCAGHGIEHRFIPRRRPQTNGMVERFNERIADVLAAHYRASRADLEALLQRYAHLSNHHIPQRVLEHKTPIQAMQEWQHKRPDIFVKQVRNQEGPDSPHVSIGHAMRQTTDLTITPFCTTMPPTEGWQCQSGQAKIRN